MYGAVVNAIAISVLAANLLISKNGEISQALSSSGNLLKDRSYIWLLSYLSRVSVAMERSHLSITLTDTFQLLVTGVRNYVKDMYGIVDIVMDDMMSVLIVDHWRYSRIRSQDLSSLGHFLNSISQMIETRMTDLKQILREE